MQKRDVRLASVVVMGLFSLFISLTFALAADTSSVQIDKAYTCLKSEIGNKSSLLLEQATFATLALGSVKLADDKITSTKSATESCWPSDGCKLKDTALVALALDREGKDTTAIEQWMMNKNATPTELNWYLEIDIKDHSSATCIVSYDSSNSQFFVNDDMTLSRGSVADCLSISNNKFWLKIGQNCLAKNYQVSCNKDFVSALLYDKTGGDTIYVSSESHTAAANATTNEVVTARCLKTQTSCDYEGTLWAAFALNKLDSKNDVSAYVPYLNALAEDNTKFFPSALLLPLGKTSTTSNFLSDIVQRQKSNGIWDVTGSPYKKYFDTSLALLALSSTSAESLRAKTALLTMQKDTGCWSERDAIIDTAFLLYSGWQRTPTKSTSGGGGTDIKSACTSVTSYSCELRNDCLSANATVLDSYTCSGGSVCCSQKIPQRTCSQLQGSICTSAQQCSSSNMQQASDGACCLDQCVAKAVPGEDTCTPQNGSCKLTCDTTANEQETTTLTCSDSANKCCQVQVTENTKPATSYTWLIILLLVLIAIVVAAIIYREKLTVYYYKYFHKGKGSPSRPTGPEGPSQGLLQRPSPPAYTPSQGPRVMRPMAGPGQVPGPRPPVARGPPSPRDKELEDTLKKLKEMSK